MVKTPVLPISHSAATTAPKAKPSLICAMCSIFMVSTSLLYVMLCVPGTFSIRLAVIGNSLSSFHLNSKIIIVVFSIISSAKVIAVPLGASNF